MQVDGKLLCWLCTLSLKRALDKARKSEADARLNKKRTSSSDKPHHHPHQMKENHKKTRRGSDAPKQALPEIPE